MLDRPHWISESLTASPACWIYTVASGFRLSSVVCIGFSSNLLEGQLAWYNAWEIQSVSWKWTSHNLWWAHSIQMVISNSQCFWQDMKISIFSNDQTCYLIDVRSIIYSISCSHQSTDWIGLCGKAIEFGKKFFSEDLQVWDIENFTFIIQLFEEVWAAIHKLCRKCSGVCLPMILVVFNLEDSEDSNPLLSNAKGAEELLTALLQNSNRQHCRHYQSVVTLLSLSWINWMCQSYQYYRIHLFCNIDKWRGHTAPGYCRTG